MIRACVVTALALAFLAPPAPAQTVIAWSPSTEGYGWCNGGDTACAVRACSDTGAADCTPVAACGPGWFAVATPEGARLGITVVCGIDRANEAQLVALAACISVANDLCWTRDVVEVGGERRDDAGVAETDRLMYAQALLQLTGRGDNFLISGEADRATIAAIGAFQARVGLPVTGLTEPPLIFHLIAAAGGRQLLVDSITHNVTWRHRDKGILPAAAIAADPPARRTPGEEWRAMPPAEATLALTTYLLDRGYACDRTAAAAAALDAAGRVWSLACPEAGYTVTFADQSTLVETKPAPTP